MTDSSNPLTVEATPPGVKKVKPGCFEARLHVTAVDNIRMIISRRGATPMEARDAICEAKEQMSRHPDGWYTPQLGNTNLYFIRGVKGGPIKIGLANDVEQRRAAMEMGSPVRLVVMHILRDASREIEAWMHAKYKRRRLHGEWFESVPVGRYVAVLRRRGSFHCSDILA